VLIHKRALIKTSSVRLFQQQQLTSAFSFVSTAFLPPSFHPHFREVRIFHRNYTIIISYALCSIGVLDIKAGKQIKPEQEIWASIKLLWNDLLENCVFIEQNDAQI